MKLHRLTFTHEALRTLSEAEQIFFCQIAHVRNDLRHLDHLCLVAAAAVEKAGAECRDVALHQLLFGLRTFYGTLAEGWNVIDAGWNGRQLGRSFHTRLSDEARTALRFLTKYFSNSNLVREVRNSSAFHYDGDSLLAPLAGMSPKAVHSLVTGTIVGNVFYTFAEDVHVQALVSLTGKADQREAVRAFYDEAHREVYPRFAQFTDSVLLEIVKTLDWKSEPFEAETTDPALVESVLFIDEDAARRASDA